MTPISNDSILNERLIVIAEILEKAGEMQFLHIFMYHFETTVQKPNLGPIYIFFFNILS